MHDVDHDDQESPLEPQFDHHPIRPPRQDVVGDIVFSERWLALMDETGDEMDEVYSNVMLNHILSSMRGPLNQRRASVAASFIRWLGSNNGQAFLRSAEDHVKAQSTKPKYYAWLSAWTIQNFRERNHGGGRILELILSPEANTPVEFSSDDAEVVEHLVAWLSSGKGEEFRSGCQAEIQRRCKAQRESALHA